MIVRDIVDEILKDRPVYVLTEFWMDNWDMLQTRTIGVYFVRKTALLDVCKLILKDLDIPYSTTYYNPVDRQWRYGCSEPYDSDDKWNSQRSMVCDYKIEQLTPNKNFQQRDYLNFDHQFKKKIIDSALKFPAILKLIDQMKRSVDDGHIPTEIYEMMSKEDLSWQSIDYPGDSEWMAKFDVPQSASALKT